MSKRARAVGALVLLAVGGSPVLTGPFKRQSVSLVPAARPEQAGGDAIVVLRPSASPARIAERFGLAPAQLYTTIFNGFAARLDPGVRARLRGDDDVTAVVADGASAGAAVDLTPVPPYPQVPDRALRRIGALASPTARIDGHDERVDADIAIIDSGIQPDNPDLNVVGGIDCTGSGSTADVVGHGTFAAGLAGALDNGVGGVGVAPGVRLWAVKVSSPDDTASDSALLCGLEWVANHTATIDVVNLSLGGPGTDGDCTAPSLSSALALEHRAICRIVADGVVVVASAGNDHVDAGNVNPASYPEVITVSAITDTDGRPGGLGGRSTCLPDADDTFASYSNFGFVVDIAAPGTCVTSTAPGGRYAIGSGTSAAAPLVAGAAALLRAPHPRWTPEDVRRALLGAATPGPIRGDPDRFAEPVLNVAGF